MHKVTLKTCAEFLAAAYAAVGQRLLATQPHLSVHLSNTAAPKSFDDLRSDAAAGLLYISEEHSEHSIYGVAGNTAFRIMHDLGHLSTGLSWSCADEIALALHQWKEIRLHILPGWRERCQAVYQADTIMQSLYCERHGCFPKNQTEFVQAALAAYN